MSLLVALLGAPTVWAVHLAVSYFVVALDCGSPWNGARAAVLVATVLCAVAAGGAGGFAWRGWKRNTVGRQDTPLNSTQVRGFLMLSGAILAALFSGAIVLAGIAPLFLPLCS